MAATENNGKLITELGVVTIRNSGDINPFNEEFIKAIAQHQHWARKNQKDLVPA